MKPHRRKKTPPRREKGADRHAHEVKAPRSVDSGAPPPPAPVAPDPAAQEVPVEPSPDPPAGPYVDPGEMRYDPGQALAEEGSNPYDETASTEGYVDPNQQGSATHYEAYVEPSAESYSDPSQQGYVDPRQAYVEPPAPPAAPASAADAGIYDDVPGAHTRKTRPRKKMAKKALAKKPVPSGAPANRPGPPLKKPGPYARPVSKSGGGISVMTVFLSLCAVIMLVIVTIVTLPKDLRNVSGYPATAAVAGEARNLLEEGQEIMVAREGELALTEEEVNSYLNERIQGKQGGLMALFVRFKGVYIDFTPGFAEIIIEREFLGMPLTMSAKIKGEKFRRQMLYKPAGWSIGKMHFKTRNIKPVIEMFMRLRKTMEDEYLTLQMMSEVRFEQDRLVLDPSAGN